MKPRTLSAGPLGPTRPASVRVLGTLKNDKRALLQASIIKWSSFQERRDDSIRNYVTVISNINVSKEKNAASVDVRKVFEADTHTHECSQQLKVETAQVSNN